MFDNDNDDICLNVILAPRIPLPPPPEGAYLLLLNGGGFKLLNGTFLKLLGE